MVIRRVESTVFLKNPHAWFLLGEFDVVDGDEVLMCVRKPRTSDLVSLADELEFAVNHYTGQPLGNEVLRIARALRGGKPEVLAADTRHDRLVGYGAIPLLCMLLVGFAIGVAVGAAIA